MLQWLAVTGTWGSMSIFSFFHNLRPVVAPPRCPNPTSDIVLKKTNVVFGVCLWFPIGHECRKVDVTHCCVDFWGPYYRYQNILIKDHLFKTRHPDAEAYSVDKVYLEVDQARINESGFKRDGKYGKELIWYIYFKCFETQSPEFLQLAYKLTSRNQLQYTPYYCVRCLPGEKAELFAEDSERSPVDRKRLTARCNKPDSVAGPLPSKESSVQTKPLIEQQDPNQKQTRSINSPVPDQLQPHGIVVSGYKRQCIRYDPTEIMPEATLNAALFDHTGNTDVIRSLQFDSTIDRIDENRPSASNAALAALHQKESEVEFDDDIAAESAEFLHETNDLQVSGFYRTTMRGLPIEDQIESHLISLPAVPSTSISLTAQLDIPSHANILRDWTEIEPTSKFQACAYNENEFNLDLSANSFISAIDGYLWPELELPSSCI